MKITVRTKDEALNIAELIAGEILSYDHHQSERAGYNVYRATNGAYACDLDTRIEFNDNGESLNIWINPLKGIEETEIDNAMEVIKDCLDSIAKVPIVIRENSELREANYILCKAYKTIEEMK